jgi:colanic acid biosynthesis glycosyl transferase WcaI
VDLAEGRVRTLLLTLVFAPDTVSTANLLSELVDRLAARGHEFTVLTSTPHYNEEADAIARQPLHPKWDHLLFESHRNGTAVYHARIRKKRGRILGRLFDYSVFHLITGAAALFLAKDHDVILVPSPPLSIGLEAAIISAIRRVPFIYNVQEIYPDVAVTLGLLKNKIAIRLLEAVERFVYRRARRITVISDRFRDRLLMKGVQPGKIKVIPNFVDTEAVRPSQQVNNFSVTQALNGRFVILYAGNVGLTQDFESLLTAAGITLDLPDIVFLVVGNGTRAQWLQEEITRRRLSNIRFLPYQPQSSVIDVYATSTLCVVPLKKGTSHGTFPSKIYTIMAAGRPAIVIADSDSELSDVVRRAECGVVIEPEDRDQLGMTIRHLYEKREQLKRWGEAGRDYVTRQHSAAATAEAYDKLLKELV